MRAILSCGGTGGHIYPAIAIADKIREKDPDAEILFIGTKKGMENNLVPAAGYEIKGIDASGFNRKNLLANFKTLADSVKGDHEAAAIIKEFKPDIAIGTGGYVTGTVILEAHRAGIPCYIHEQNAIPGLTNKILERFTTKTFISFKESENSFSHPEKTILTGNPVRAQFDSLSYEDCRRELGLGDETMILIFGGSLGAELINEAAVRLIDDIAEKNVKLYFVTGKRYYNDILEKTKGKDMRNVVLIPYADNMPKLMSACDITVSRAGAIAVSEIMVSGKASVLIPSPNVTNNHQYHNAKAVADNGAAVLLEESELVKDPDALEKALKELSDPDKRKAVCDAAKRLGKPDAAEMIWQNLNI